MDRITLTDGNGWFDRNAAIEIEEGRRWNGNNHISLATGSQWDHESLYYTRSGKWVLCTWSQWQGVSPTHTVIEEGEAFAWLVRMELFDWQLEALPADVRERFSATVDEMEV